MSPAGAADAGIVAEPIELLLGGVLHDSVDKNTGHSHEAWMQCSGFHNLPNLRQNAAAAIVSCQSNGVNVHVDGLFFGADVAARVRVSSSDDGNIDFEWLVPENLASVDLHDLHE